MNSQSEGSAESLSDRRGFFFTSTALAMTGGLVASYGTLVVMAGSFLYPAADNPVGWLFLAVVDDFPQGQTVNFTAPSGATIVVARLGVAKTKEDFVALSNVCPHLGCKVHWEQANDRFFCPCHNGAFDLQGKATEGPPAQANQSLKKFNLKVNDGLLFIEAPLEMIVKEQQLAATGNRSSHPSQAEEA